MKTKLLILIILFVISACEDFLTEVPKSEISQGQFFQSEKDLELGVIGLYDVLNDVDLYGFNLGIVAELGADTYTTMSNNDNFEMLDRYTITPAHNLTEQVWSASYKGIARCNFYINGLKTTNLVSEESENVYLAEAYVIRSLLYFNLVRLFGEVSLETAPATSLNKIYTRDPIDSTYNQIVKDLKFSRDLLPTNQNMVGRVTAGAASGLLIKVYLTMAGAPVNKGIEYYELALAEANDFEQKVAGGTYSYKLLNDYTKVFREINENNDEIILDAQSIAGELEGSRWGKWGGYGGPQNSIDNASFSTPKVIPSFYKSYIFEDSIRRIWNVTDSTMKGNGTFKVEKDTAEFTIAKFRMEPNSFSINGQYVGFQTPMNIPILRYDDVLLMLAEAENEVNGPTGKAYEYLNKIRQRVKLTPYDGTNFDELYPTYQMADAGLDINNEQDRFREAIFWERGWELCYEGHRRFDLVRWNRLVPTVKNVVRPYELKSNQTKGDNLQIFSHLNIKPFHNLLPIPSIERGISNNDYQQNLGY